MKISVQTDNFKMLSEAVSSDCDKVRFGSEFCMYKIPCLNKLKKAYTLITGAGKEMVYVTPRVSVHSLKRIQNHLGFLDGEGEIEIVVNDLGVLNILERYHNLEPHLGRQLIFIPARCPWPQITEFKVGFLKTRRVGKLFYQTSLNYLPSIQFFQGYGTRGVDVDWIPQCFPYFDFLIKNGLELSVHLHAIPVTITRRCHMARYLGEKDSESCSRPCDTRAFLLKHKILDTKLFLCGNAVFRLTHPSQRDIKKLYKTEFVITMSPLTKIESREKSNALIHNLKYRKY